jgi:hypothetical protein
MHHALPHLTPDQYEVFSEAVTANGAVKVGGGLANKEQSAQSRAAEDRQRVAGLRQAHKEAEVGIARLLTLVEEGTMAAEDSSLRERLVGLKVRRDELAREAGRPAKTHGGR